MFPGTTQFGNYYEQLNSSISLSRNVLLKEVKAKGTIYKGNWIKVKLLYQPQLVFFFFLKFLVWWQLAFWWQLVFWWQLFS